MEQLRLDFGESAEAERAAETRARADRARMFEAATVREFRARPHEAIHKLAGTLAVFVDSPSQRAAGLVGLRWAGTLAELAARVGCSPDSVAKALRRMRAAGFVTTWQTTDDRGRVNGLGVALEMRAIAGAANSETPRASAVGSGPGAYPGTGPGTDPGNNAVHYIPLFPKGSAVPPPRNIAEQTATEPAAAGVVASIGKQPTATPPRPAITTPEPTTTPTAHWADVADALRRAGVERVAMAQRAARDAGLDADAVLAIIAQYDANRGRLRGPGAIVDRIRNGDWPAEVQTVERAAAGRRAITAARREQMIEFARGDLILRRRAAGLPLEGIDFDAMAAAAVDQQLTTTGATP